MMRTVCIRLYTKRMMKPSISGIKKLVFRLTESSVSEKKTTSGSTAQALAVRVLRFTMTVEKNTAVVNRAVP